MADSDLTSKAEAALMSVTTGLSLGATIDVRTGMDDDVLEKGANVVHSVEDTGEEVPMDTGNFICVGRVTVNSNANDYTLAQHRTRVATVFDAFMDDALAATLSAAVTGFYCLAIYGRQKGKIVKEQAFCDWLELRFLACPSDL